MSSAFKTPPDNPVVIITGAARGLGRALAESLNEKGYRMVLVGRDSEKLPLTGSQTVLKIAADISGGSTAEAIIAESILTFGRVDVVINNAAIIAGDKNSDDTDVPVSEVRRALENNSLSAYELIRRVLPHMQKSGYGRIVNVSSGMGALSDMGTGYPAYRISKAALNAITVYFAAQMAGFPGILINSVCPGWVRTDMGGASAPRSVDEGIRGILWAATLPADGPTGGFFRDGKPIPW